MSVKCQKWDFHNDTFKQPFLLLIGDAEHADNHLKHKYFPGLVTDESLINGPGACGPIAGTDVIFIYLADDASCGDVAHECYHAMTYMLTLCGAEVGEELCAYVIGWLVDEVMCRFGE